MPEVLFTKYIGGHQGLHALNVYVTQNALRNCDHVTKAQPPVVFFQTQQPSVRVVSFFYCLQFFLPVIVRQHDMHAMICMF